MSNTILKLAIASVAVLSFSQFGNACDYESNQCYSKQHAQCAGSSVRYYVVPRRNIQSSRDTQQRLKPAQATARPLVESGVGYRLTGRNYGIQLGSVVLSIGAIELECEILSWAGDEVTFRVPPLTLKKEVDATLAVATADGVKLTSKNIRLRGTVLQRAEATETPRATEAPQATETIEPFLAPPAPFQQSPSIIDSPPAPAAPFDLGQGLDGE